MEGKLESWKKIQRLISDQENKAFRNPKKRKEEKLSPSPIKNHRQNGMLRPWCEYKRLRGSDHLCIVDNKRFSNKPGNKFVVTNPFMIPWVYRTGDHYNFTIFVNGWW